MNNGERGAFDALRTTQFGDAARLKSFTPHCDYNEYLKIHKVLVGEATANKLERIYSNLQQEELPRYLSAAGWAGVEAALAQPNTPATYRMSLLSSAEVSWTRALENQLAWNERGNEGMSEHGAPFRCALDLAHMPLFRALVSGDVTEITRKNVFRDVLNIAEANAIQLNLATIEKNQEAIGDHVGIGHECNALLAFHSLNSPSLLAVPSSARADSGHYHPHQTHDLLIIQQKWGEILDMTPAEIKSTVSQKDRARYKALLIRGKMHLSVVGKYSPEHTLAAFGALFAGTQTEAERTITDYARQTILSLYWRYKEGAQLEGFASSDSSCRYRDPSSVHAAYPEIAPHQEAADVARQSINP